MSGVTIRRAVNKPRRKTKAYKIINQSIYQTFTLTAGISEIKQELRHLGSAFIN